MNHEELVVTDSWYRQDSSIYECNNIEINSHY
jgi:hypothetical protein